MKKVYIVIALLVSVLSTNVSAQTLEVDWGSSQPVEKGTFFQKVLGGNDDGFYALRTDNVNGFDGDKIWLEFISSAMKTVDMSNELILPAVKGKKSDYAEMFYLNGKIILFTTVSDFDRQRLDLYVQYIKDDGTLKNKPKKIGGMSLTNTGKFNFVLSEGKDKIMVTYHSDFTQYAGEPYSVKVIDETLAVTFDKELVVTPLMDRKFSDGKVKLGESGNIYFTVLAEKVGGRRTAALTYEPILVVYNMLKEEFDVYPIALKKYLPTDVSFGFDEDENVFVFGFFKGKTKNDLLGVFYQKIDPRTEKVAFPLTSKFNYKVFTKGELLVFKDKRNLKAGEHVYDYKLNEVIALDNGKMMFVAEQSYLNTRTMVDPKTKAETIIKYPVYGDIIVALGDNKGKMQWIKRIMKKQSSINDNGYMSSYQLYNEKTKVKLLFNDNASNTKGDGAVSSKVKEFKNNPAKSPKGMPFVVSIYPDGSWEKDAMFEGDNLKNVIVPKLVTRTSAGIVVYGQKGKEFKFGTFEFE